MGHLRKSESLSRSIKNRGILAWGKPGGWIAELVVWELGQREACQYSSFRISFARILLQTMGIDLLARCLTQPLWRHKENLHCE